MRHRPPANFVASPSRRRVGRASRPAMELAARRRPNPQPGTAALLQLGDSFPLRRRPAAVWVSANSAGMSREAWCRNPVWKFLFTSSGQWQPSPVAACHPLPSDGRGTSPMEPLPKSNGPDHFTRFRFFIQNVMFHSQSTIPVFPMEVLGRCYAGVSDRAMVFYGGIFQPPRHQGIFSCLPAFLVILKNAVQPRMDTDTKPLQKTSGSPGG